jgi:hypothetical protein
MFHELFYNSSLSDVKNRCYKIQIKKKFAKKKNEIKLKLK